MTSSVKPKSTTSEILIKLLSVDKEYRDIVLIEKYYIKMRKEQEKEAIQRDKAIKKEAVKKAKEEEKEAVKKAKAVEKEIVKKAKDVEKEAVKKAKDIEQEAVKKAKDDISKAKEVIKIAKNENIKSISTAIEERKKAIKIGIENNKPSVEKKDNDKERFVILTKYNIFVREYQKRIMEMYPDIKNNERMVKIGIEWRKHNAMIAYITNKYSQGGIVKIYIYDVLYMMFYI